MSFFAVLLALLIEQIKPLPRVNRVGQALQAWVAWVARTLDAGQRRHARIVWAVSVLVPTAVAAPAAPEVLWGQPEPQGPEPRPSS